MAVNETKKRKRLRIKPGVITWLLLAVMNLVFAFFVYRFPLVPKKWKHIILAGLAILAAVLAFFSSYYIGTGCKTWHPARITSSHC